MSLDTVQDIALFDSKAMLCEVFEFLHTKMHMDNEL